MGENRISMVATYKLVKVEQAALSIYTTPVTLKDTTEP